MDCHQTWYMCIDIVITWFRIAYGQTSSIFDSGICPGQVLFPDDNFSKYEWIFMKLDMCIDIVDICFRIANG